LDEARKSTDNALEFSRSLDQYLLALWDLAQVYSSKDFFPAKDFEHILEQICLDTNRLVQAAIALRSRGKPM
jgi:hypothetical protein